MPQFYPRPQLEYDGIGWNLVDFSVPRLCRDKLMAEEVFTIKEVAALLKLAEKTVYSMANSGELPAFKVRGQWRIRGAQLERWMEEQPRGGGDGRT